MSLYLHGMSVLNNTSTQHLLIPKCLSKALSKLSLTQVSNMLLLLLIFCSALQESSYRTLCYVLKNILFSKGSKHSYIRYRNFSACPGEVVRKIWKYWC